MSYNGYTNYETWNVCLWLSNDEGTYRFWQAHRERLSGEVDSEDLAQTLAKELEEEVWNNHPLQESAGMYSDLITRALSQVNWVEIAESILEE